jgi:hypothetical protein
MVRRQSRNPRPFEIVMDEAAGETVPWDLDEHLNGCLAAYQLEPSYGAAVFFALEVLWGIARDVGIRAKAGALAPTQLDERWILCPTTTVPVPWMWIRLCRPHGKNTRLKAARLAMHSVLRAEDRANILRSRQ